ncbi:GTP cyclohydrolase II [Burkholderia pseudomallei]|uniref:GTP cyclohydrolase II n=1 Tax=Burkholderia pseudomallei TaxID=28450 RepID=UPI000F062B2C|nr:GTP cyclohydrolase II [Burkholderia pseudomallei]VBY40143.1 GTP cyclohydrolase II [Burkholderia pseudomallei]VBY63073.1 GTP cyclohydrolase II [Burkholderia pseudomallei]VBY77275.1 GTP cyclohydrolase II [Burkholderia pseudomallei]VBY88167.1 GTP cyclohydrolase II [Burkholderia pseudomallei]
MRLPEARRASVVISDRLVRYAESTLPTRVGSFRLIVYRTESGQEPIAIVAGDPAGERTLARVHSECWTGEVLGSLRCDCREQLEAALTAIRERGRGLVVYLRQEGRGIGLGNKVRAYDLQDRGADTVDANRLLGFPDDLRTYEFAASIFDDLGVRSVDLMTNNPRKIEALKALGVRVDRRISHWSAEHEHNQGYLRAKRARLGHLP